MSFAIGQIIGDYEVVEDLGSGGHGHVFKVRHPITKRLEAMKVLAGGVPVTEDERLRFLREIQVQARLSHPNIAAVHHAFWVGDNLAMVMEYVEGKSLQRMLADGPVKPEEGIGYVRQVLNALIHSHYHHVVHRDVSPANIIVGASGSVKLTDFGLARGAADAPITASGALVGSLRYMSPEQVRGVDAPDARSDIYSCGVILFQILTGRLPFESDSAFSLMQAHVQQEPPSPRSINPNVTPGMNRLILKALAKDPEDRFQTAEDFRTALDAGDSIPEESACAVAAAAPPAAPAEKPKPVQSLAAPMGSPAPVRARKPALQAAGLALGVLVVTLILGAVFWFVRNSKTQPAPVQALTPVAAPASETAAPPPASAEGLTRGPAQPFSPESGAWPAKERPKPASTADTRRIQAEREAARRAARAVRAPEPQRARITGLSEGDRRIITETPDASEDAGPKTFRPPERAKKSSEIALAQPPALPSQVHSPNGDGGKDWFVAPDVPSVAKPQETTAPPAPGSGRVGRFFGKVKSLNPFRQKPAEPASKN